MERKTLIGITPELFWTIVSAIVVGAFFLGLYIGQAKFDKEKSDYYEGNKILKQENENLIKKLDSCKKNLSTSSVGTFDIFLNGIFGQDLYLGENTSGQKTEWANVVNNELFMNYPSGQEYGSVFITVGVPSKEPPPPRASRNFTAYKTLILEIKGDSGSTILVGLKGNTELDNGKESKYLITLKNGWNTYEINMRDNFKTANLGQLYLVTEFVFGNVPQKLYARKIQFI